MEDEIYIVEAHLKDNIGDRICVVEAFNDMEQANACCEYMNIKFALDGFVFFWYHVEMCDVDYVSMLEQM